MTTRKIAKQPAAKKTSVAAKPVATSRPATKPAAKAASGSVPVKAAKKAKKEHKAKVVRDSFTMPQDEYQKIAEIKAACLKAKLHVKKSEVLRAGLKLLAELDATRLTLVLKSLEKIKTGRPNKH